MDLKLSRSECDLIIWCLKPLEEELGMDITLLIDKVERYKNIVPKQEGVVELEGIWLEEFTADVLNGGDPSSSMTESGLYEETLTN